jgi:transcriptional regulator GlxA family with amidase domain
MRFAILVYEGTEPIDLATYGVLSMARRIVPEVSMFLVAERAGPVVLANGLTVIADHGYADAPPADVLMITGGPGWQREARSGATLDFVRRYSLGVCVAAVCTGGMILAASGLLDGKPATTKREVCGAEISPLALMRERHPAIRALDARLVDCGPVLTGGGVSLCIDMTLHLLARFLGEAVARETARIIEYSAAVEANEARLPAVNLAAAKP